MTQYDFVPQQSEYNYVAYYGLNVSVRHCGLQFYQYAPQEHHSWQEIQKSCTVCDVNYHDFMDFHNVGGDWYLYSDIKNCMVFDHNELQ